MLPLIGSAILSRLILMRCPAFSLLQTNASLGFWGGHPLGTLVQLVPHESARLSYYAVASRLTEE